MTDIHKQTFDRLLLTAKAGHFPQITMITISPSQDALVRARAKDWLTGLLSKQSKNRADKSSKSTKYNSKKRWF